MYPAQRRDRRNHVGGLVGYNNGGTVTESHATSCVGGLVWIGGLVGTNEGGLITESYATGNVSSGSGAGGLVGKNSGTVTESYATGDASGVITVVGGLLGQNSGTVNESYATGDVEALALVGGLVGRINSGTVSGSYATGDVTGDNDRAGGFAGGKNGGTITDGYWDDEAATVIKSGTEIHESVGNGDDSGVTGLTTTEMTGGRATGNLAFDFSSTWQTTSDDGSIDGFGVFYPTLQNNVQQPAPSGTLYAGGDGSVGAPYEIANWYHLDNVRQNLGANFTLVSDLNEATAGYDA
ncbi:MAG: GLUG domain protein, partial [Haloquadratum sp. J07HQX50]